jgi:hypothetical protein
MRALYLAIALLTVGILSGTSCRKVATLTQGGVLKFSADTLKFDTVFTNEGSFTNWVMLYNPQSEAVVVSSVRLQSGAASYFHLNVDGFTGNSVQNIKIAPHDSVYVFATVKINPNDTTTPFLITDHLIATLNGKDFSIPLTAYGQNAHYIVSDSFGSGTTTTWLTDKPYVVIHNCIIGPYATLNIPRGCRVYMHQDAQMIVWSFGALNIGQTPAASTDSVVFQGDRLDRAYFGYVGYPGEWCGLWYLGLSSGRISNTVLKNCGNGAAYLDAYVQPAAIRVDTAAYVRLDHSFIRNSISLGIFSFQGHVSATNCLVSTTGGQALAIARGGLDSFVNCTFANYGTAQVSHASAGTAVINDWFTPDNKHYYYGNLDVTLQNCIVYGSLDSEMICDTTYSPAGTLASLKVINCILKMGQVREPFISFVSTLFNKDPMFKDQANGDFHLQSGSPAIDAGADVPLSTDLDYKPRPAGAHYDIGCYESQ